MGILGPFKYAAEYASIHARLGRLLSKNSWEDLLNASTLQTFAQRLTKTHYEDVIDYLNIEQANEKLDIGRLERGFRGHLARASHQSLTFLSGTAKKLVEWRLRRFEVDNLKTILRAVERNIDPDETKRTLIPLEAISPIPWNNLAALGSVPDVVEQLQETFYGHALQPAMDKYHREDSLLVLEVRLDLTYYKKLLNIIRQLRGKDRKEAVRLLGTMIDGQNVLWAFRSRTYYDLSPEEILNYSLLDGFNVHVDQIKTIAMGADLYAMTQEIWKDKIPGLEQLKGMPEKEALSEFEQLLHRDQYRQAKAIRDSYAMHLGLVLSFDILLETEVHDLISIAEGISIGLPRKEIRSYLIRDLDQD